MTWYLLVLSILNEENGIYNFSILIDLTKRKGLKVPNFLFYFILWLVSVYSMECTNNWNIS